MGYRTNTPNSGESIFVSKGGANNLSGNTEEAPVLTINQATDNAISTGATNIILGDGNYDEELTVPDGVSIRGVGAALFTSGDNETTIKAANSSVIDIGAALVSGSNSTGIIFDGKTRSLFMATTFVLGSFAGSPTGSIGIKFTGVNDDVFFKTINGECRADNSTLLEIDGESPTPFAIGLGTFTNFNDDLTVINHSPSDAFQISHIFVVSFADDPDSSVTGTVFVTGDAGRLVLSGGTIDLLGKDFAIVKSGLSLSISFNVIAGDITVNSGGQLLSTVLGLLIGDVLLETGSVSRGNIVEVDGDVTIESGASFDGVIGQVTGTIIIDPDADVNGIIDGVRFGTWRVLDVVVLKGVDTTTQNPTGIGAPLQITFGPAQVNSEVSVDALGSMTIHVENEYFFRTSMQAGRVNNGGVADLHFRLLVDGVLSGEQVYFAVDGAGDDAEIVIESDPLDLDVGQVVTVEMLRSITGMNDGSLFPVPPVQAGWTTTPSASVTVTRRT